MDTALTAALLGDWTVFDGEDAVVLSVVATAVEGLPDFDVRLSGEGAAPDF